MRGILIPFVCALALASADAQARHRKDPFGPLPFHGRHLLVPPGSRIIIVPPGGSSHLRPFGRGFPGRQWGSAPWDRHWDFPHRDSGDFGFRFTTPGFDWTIRPGHIR